MPTQGIALGYAQTGLSARPIATGGCVVGRGNLAHRLHAPRIGDGLKAPRGAAEARKRSLAENGLKAQKRLAQGKRSDTLGNTHPAYSHALKGQKHIYGRRGMPYVRNAHWPRTG